MRLKLFFCLLGLSCLLSTSMVEARSNAYAAAKPLSFSISDVYFDFPKGSGGGSRSATFEIPVAGVIVDNNLIKLDFIEAIGEVEVTISQDGTPIYSSSENILAPVSTAIQLDSDLSGNFLLEIKGANGACAYAWFAL